MNTPTLRHAAEDLAFDARVASMLPPLAHDDLAHARARRALVAAAEAGLSHPAPARASHLRLVTALAFAAATAAAAAVTTRVFLASSAEPAASAPVAAHAPAEAKPVARSAEEGRRAGDEPPSIGPESTVEALAPAPNPEPAVVERSARVGAPRAEPSPAREAPSPAGPSVEAHAPTSGERFAEAMRAYLAGDFATAEARFDAFCIDYAEDPRAEDAAFLRADARAKHGDFQGARAAARSYLKRYPNGLRRPEAERLAAMGL